jgi:hypothetical protein
MKHRILDISRVLDPTDEECVEWKMESLRRRNVGVREVLLREFPFAPLELMENLELFLQSSPSTTSASIPTLDERGGTHDRHPTCSL